MKALLALLGLAAAVVGILMALGHPVLPAGWTLPGWTPPSPTALRSVRLEAPRVADPVPGGPLEAQRLLRDGRFRDLTALLEDAHERAGRDPRLDGALAQVLRAFAVTDPAVTAHVERWAVASPGSFAPRLARARHRVTLAWSQGGGRDASDPTPDELAERRRLLSLATADAHEALQREPTLAEGHALLVEIDDGSIGRCLVHGVQGLTVAPTSVVLRIALADCFARDAGGARTLLDGLAREAAAHATAQPALAVLGGMPDWARGHAAAAHGDHRAALAAYDRALGHGAHWRFHEDRATSLVALGRPEDAIAALDQALALRPEDPDVLVRRAALLADLGRVTAAVADVRLVEEMAPTSDTLLAFRRDLLASAEREGTRLLDRGDADGALRAFTKSIVLTGGSAAVFHGRGRAHLRRGDEARALADLEDALRLDPRRFESYRLVAELLARRRAWGEVVDHWTRYLAIAPESGPAHLGRARAHRARGEGRAAARDAERACTLGVRDACAFDPAADA